MKFLKTGKYLIVVALVFAIAVTAVSVAATTDDNVAPSDNMDTADMGNTEIVSEDLPVNMGEDGKTYIELDKVNITFNIDTERTVENVMKAVVAKAEEITNKYDQIKLTLDTDEENSYDYILLLRRNPLGNHIVDCEWEWPTDGIEYSASQGHHKNIIRTVYHFTINVKDNPDRRDDIQYLVFLYLLMREYPDSTTNVLLNYDDSFSCTFFGGGALFLCPEYREYGYDNIIDYYIDLEEGKATNPSGAYWIDCNNKNFGKLSKEYSGKTFMGNAITPMYEDIFGK